MTAEKILKFAASYIGIKENPPDSNNVIFNTHYYGHAVNGSAYPWCMVFQWDIFRLAGASELFFGGGKTASCNTLMQYAKAHGQWVTSGYKPGDLVIFDFPNTKYVTDHVGIIVEVRGNSIITIEGNTAVGNDSNGGEVMKRTRPLAYVIGAYRPKYESEVEDEMAQYIEQIAKQAGVSTDTVVSNLAVLVKLANTKEDAWEKDGLKALTDLKLINSTRPANAPVAFGELGLILQRFTKILGK